MSTEDQTSIEDRVRTATRAGAGLIRDVRPLGTPAPVRLRRLPEPVSRRWFGWGAPLAAAAAVVAIALILVAARQPGTPPPAASRSATATAPATVPTYYVAREYDAAASRYPGPLIVGDDLTGKVIATVSQPHGMEFTSVQGTSDDHTFVVMAASPPAGSPTYTWYLLRIAPGSAHRYQLIKLPAELPGNTTSIFAYALSPDGRELAVESQLITAAGNLITLGIYSVSSGAELRAWTTAKTITSGVGATTLSWLSGGRKLVFLTDESLAGTSYRLGLRALDVKGAGTDLMAASRALLTLDNMGEPTCASLHITPDGGTAICATQYAFLTGTGTNAGCANGGLEFTALSVPITLSPAPVLYKYRGACHTAISYMLWTDASANSVIGATRINPDNEGGKETDQVGVITGGHFRPFKIAKSVSPNDYGTLAF